MVPSNFTAATVSDLIADINAANLAGGTNSIALVAGKTFTLTAVNNTTDGATGLPVIAANDNLTILGNSDTIERSTAAGTPAFRLFNVASGASLKLENLTLQGGLAYGAYLAAKGGAIYNHGTLDLNGDIVQNNIAQGQLNQFGAAGGIYSSGSLTLEGGTTIQNNQALGGQGGLGWNSLRRQYFALPGKGGVGGGLCVDAGTVTLSNVTLSSNTAQGGPGGGGSRVSTGGAGGPGQGGGLFAIGATVTLSNVTVSSNTAVGGSGGAGASSGGTGGSGLGGGVYAAQAAGSGALMLRNDSLTYNTAKGGTGGSGTKHGSLGLAEGGGLCTEPLATVYLDAFTLKNLKGNTPADIYGPYNANSMVLVGGFHSPATAGVAGNITVTALDSSGNTCTGYTGTVHFTSTDPQAVLPADYSFTSADHGVHTFAATLKTAGAQSISLTDKNTTTLTSTESGIYVNAAAGSVMVVSGFPSLLAAGETGSFTVKVTDAYGNVTGYTGAVAFTSSDGQASLPAAHTFTAADHGSHTFSATLRTAGTQSIIAKDTAAPAITGTEAGIVINPAAVARLSVAGPANTTAGTAFSITVTAEDAFNNTATSFIGTVSLTSTDNSAVLPGSYTFTAADQGVHTFTNGVILKTAGAGTVTATSSGIPSGLIGWWPGEGNANDLVGGNNGTLVGGVKFAPGEVGQAFSLNGTDAYVDFGSAPAFNVQDFTLDAWVFVDPAQNTGERRVLSRDDIFVEGPSGRQLYALKTSSNAGGNGCARIEILAGGAFTAVTAPSPLTAGFHHLAATRAGDTLSLYVDGLLVASGTTTISGVLAPNAPLVLGQVSPAYNGEFFQGLVDEADLCNRALSPAEIQWIYNESSAGKYQTITGSARVTVNPASASMFVVSSLSSSVYAGVPFSITVTALDAYGNVATGYAGIVHFKSTDQTASLPADFTFTAADNGVHTFTGISLSKTGSQSITVDDTLFASILGSDVFKVL